MSRYRLLALTLALATWATAADYDPASSRVMVRTIAAPTRAALDLSAWLDNNLKPLPSTGAAAADAAVEGLLAAGVGGLVQTPLSEAERAAPVAIEPLLAWLAVDDFDAVSPAYRAVLTLARRTDAPLPTGRAWLQAAADGAATVWLEVVLDPATGAHAVAPLATPLPAALAQRVAGEYRQAALDAAAVDKYFSELCAKWYQARRTFLLNAEERASWPNAETEAEVVAELAGQRYDGATVIMHGLRGDEATGHEVYNVFLVDAAGDGAAVTLAPTAVAAPAVAASVAVGDEANRARWAAELAGHGGDWAAWAAAVAPLRTAAAARAAALGEDERVLAGDDGWLFFRRGFEYLAADDLRDQADGRDPFPAITDFQQQLAGRGIDLLLVLIPDKVEVYPERAGLEVPADGLVQPATRRLVAELSAAGVETVDLLAAMLAAKAADPTLLYLPTDTHWTPAGLELAAATIAARVRAYPWYTAGTTAYTRESTEFGRQGDLVGMLGGAAAADFRPERLTARQVRLPDGTFYADDPASPIVVLGDSFCGIYHHEDCEHAGLSAHLAAELGQPVDLLMAHGSGPRIRGQLARRGAAAIDAKQLVVWTVAASDLWQYWAPWDPIPLP